MQNQLGASGTSNTVGGVNTNMVQIQTTKGQPQRYYTVDMNTYPHKLVSVPRPNSSYITIQPGTIPQIVPMQNNNNSQQYVRIQLPNVQQGSNFIGLQGASNQVTNMTQTNINIGQANDSNNQGFVTLPASVLNNPQQIQNLNQQKVSIQLVQQPQQQQQQQVVINPQTLPDSNQQIRPNLNTIHLSDGVHIRPLLLSPQKPNSLVGTVSIGQPTQMLQIGDFVQHSSQQQQLDQQRLQQQQLQVQKQQLPQQQYTFIQASPVKRQRTGSVSIPITSSSLFQAFQQAANNSTPLNTPLVTRLPTSSIQTVLTSLNPQQVNFQTQLQRVQQTNTLSQQQQQQQGTTIIYGSGTTKADEQGFQGTIMMVSANQAATNKQQVLAPKITQAPTQQTPMFVPITMANNVSVLTNQASTLMTGKRVGQIGPSTTLRIQQQIAPRLSLASVVTSSTPSITNLTASNQQQKILIPVQQPAEQQQQQQQQQQYIIQTVPQNILHLNPQYGIKQQAQQRKEVPPPIPVTKQPSKTPSTSSTGSIADAKPVKKPCNCTKSQCLKLYCECFANGEFCNNCNCRLCHNSIAHEVERSKAIKSCLERNPYAFHPKIGKGKVKGDNERRHTKGCNCKRSGCLKNYCECYEAKIMCSNLCKCSGCKNFEESADRQTLMHLADAAEVRVLQQNAAKTKLSATLDTSQKKTISQKENLPFTFMTADVSKATCDVLLARVQEAEVRNLSPEETEQSIIEEFSRCLDQIIEKSKKVKKGKR